MTTEKTTMTPEEAWRHLRQAGRELLIDLESNERISGKPEWLDEARWLKAREAINKFRIGVGYSSFTGLLLILQLPDGLEPLLSTGQSRDIPALYQRYLSTVVHVTSWYEDDVFNPDTKGYKSIRQVRSMHKRVQQTMNERFQVKDVEGQLGRKWMNQYDMSMTQFAFIGLAMLWPEKSAMISATPEELELINYYWRVLGWLMGIEDEFNLCQFERYEDIKRLMELVFQEEYMASFKRLPCPTGLAMTQSICLALHYYMPLITFNSLAHWWSDCFHFNGYQLQPLTARDRLLLMWTKLSFNHLLKWNPFVTFTTNMHKRKFEQRLKQREKVYEKLKVQYKDQTDHVYLSDRCDYFANNKKQQEVAPADAAGGPTEDSNNNSTDDATTTKPLTASAKTNGACPFGYGAAAVTVEPVVA